MQVVQRRFQSDRLRSQYNVLIAVLNHDAVDTR
jgi:hypothetical protein